MADSRNTVLLEFVAFAAIVAVFLIFGATWGWRSRVFPGYGFYIRGTAAVVCGVLFVLAGLLIVLLADRMPGAR